MRLSIYLLIKALLPTNLLSILMIIVPTIVIYVSIQSWTTGIGDILKNAEIQNLSNRMLNLEKLIQDVFAQINSDLTLLLSYSVKIFSKQYQGNQYYNSSQSPAISTDFSSWYQGQPGTSLYLDESSLLDDPFRAVHKANERYSQLFIGFEDGFFRKFPWSRSDTYRDLQYVCASTGQSVIGFIPACRIWYELAKNNPGKVVLTTPYTFADSRETAVTAAIAVSVNGDIIGVVGADISMEHIQQILLSQKVLDEGYSFIVDTSGNLIFYPNLKRDRIYTIQELEGITISGMPNTVFTYQKNGKDWLMIFSNIQQTNYIACMVVPADAVNKSKLDLDADNSQAIKVIAIVSALVLALITFFEVVVSRYVALLLIRPLGELVEFLNKVAKQDLEHQLEVPALASKNICKAYHSFKDLSEALKSVTGAYLRGDFGLAMENLEKVEKLMRKAKNKRVLGIVCSIKANLMRLYWNIFDDIVVEYRKSLDLASELIKEAKGQNDKQLKTDLGERYMNFAVFFMERGEFDLSMEYYEMALKTHKEIDNATGIAHTCGNKAQLLIQFDRFDEAAELLAEVVAYAKNPAVREEDSQKLMQYAFMNYGLLNLKQNRKDEAAINFMKALNSAKILDVHVLRICLSNLMRYHEENGNDEKKAKVADVFDNVFPNEFKQVNFVLDISGSMFSSISHCRKSIKDIIQNKLKRCDIISLWTFNNQVTNVFQNLKIEDELEEILDHVDHNTVDISGGTAFYRALDKTMRKTKAENSWIVALTDGADNASGEITARYLRENYRRFMANIIVITIGEIRTENEIKSICDEAEKCNKVGKHIKILNSEAEIREAFDQAAQVMNGRAFDQARQVMKVRGDVVFQNY